MAKRRVYKTRSIARAKAGASKYRSAKKKASRKSMKAGRGKA